ncbi:MAG: 30S ribosomal protein S2 [Rickettsiaceae bacterium]|nr:30S ribosomal protein S2 [Rickettsiaceae bacterium]
MTKNSTVSISEMLNAGVHFGHRASRWNPKMAPYIYGVKDDVHIIDLRKTSNLFTSALKIFYEVAKKNGKILFVGTKVQASNLISEYAEKCGQYYINHRWLGGMLTNWGTINKSIKKLETLEKTLEDEEIIETHTKKELLDISRKCDKLKKSLGGIRKLGGKPDLIFIVDTNKEHLAIKEAQKLGVPIIGIVDTNSDPDGIDYIIPGNDDAIRSIEYYCRQVSDTILLGIEDSLRASGVDLGELAEGGFKHKNEVSKIKKIKTPKRHEAGSESNSKNSGELVNHLNESEVGSEDSEDFAGMIEKHERSTKASSTDARDD